MKVSRGTSDTYTIATYLGMVIKESTWGNCFWQMKFPKRMKPD